jgi:prepilin-type N-terminal cleavage/methylation domain-containing protein
MQINIIRRKYGVTFIELLVSIVILAVTLSSIINLFGSAKRWIEVSQSRMTMAEITKRALGPLQMQVREDQWSIGANCLSAGACPPTNWQIQSRNYNVAYIINRDQPINNVNRVIVVISWTNEQVF